MNNYLYSGSEESLERILAKYEYAYNYKIARIDDAPHGAVLMGEVQYDGDIFKCAYYTKTIIRENNEYRITSKHATMVLDKGDYVIMRAF